MGGKTLLTALALVMAGLSACQTVPTYSGAHLYASNCASCHGVYGGGDGPVAAVLKIPTADLRYLAAANDGVFPGELVHKIIDGRELRVAHGRRQMPVWGEEFLAMEGFDAEAEARVQAKIETLVAHLESIQVTE